MTKKRNSDAETHWCFAIVNGKLAELWFEKNTGKSNLFAHAYIKRGEYEAEREQKMIDTDTAKYRFSWQKGIYKDLNSGEKFKPHKPDWVS